jgi:hypothetical protein
MRSLTNIKKCKQFRCYGKPLPKFRKYPNVFQYRQITKWHKYGGFAAKKILGKKSIIEKNLKFSV